MTNLIYRTIYSERFGLEPVCDVDPKLAAQKYLDLVRFCRDDVIEDYYVDAGERFSEIRSLCELWDINRAESQLPSRPKVGRAEVDKLERPYAGPFMVALLSRLEGLLGQSACINLLLTSILSKLAYLPGRLFHDLLLSPTLSPEQSFMSLYAIMSRVLIRCGATIFRV